MCHTQLSSTQPNRFMPLKFHELQIAMYAAVPDSPPPLGRESGTETMLLENKSHLLTNHPKYVIGVTEYE